MGRADAKSWCCLYREGSSLRAKRSNPWINCWIASLGFALLAMTTLFLNLASALGVWGGQVKHRLPRISWRKHLCSFLQTTSLPQAAYACLVIENNSHLYQKKSHDFILQRNVFLFHCRGFMCPEVLEYQVFQSTLICNLRRGRYARR